MIQADLFVTKQRKQISRLKNCLEKRGWQIVEEIQLTFPHRWPEIPYKTDNPMRIVSWVIRRRVWGEDIVLDFDAYIDHWGNLIDLAYCSECTLRGTEIELSFDKDTWQRDGLTKQKWEQALVAFLDSLDEYEKGLA